MSPYYFSTLADEYARRGEHVEITRPDGERVLLVGKQHPEPWMESSFLYPRPPADVSTCAEEIDTEMPVEYPDGWWRLPLAVCILSVLASAVWTRFF